jgi:hypothetical protein
LTRELLQWLEGALLTEYLPVAAFSPHVLFDRVPLSLGQFLAKCLDAFKTSGEIVGVTRFGFRHGADRVVAMEIQNCSKQNVSLCTSTDSQQSSYTQTQRNATSSVVRAAF